MDQTYYGTAKDIIPSRNHGLKADFNSPSVTTADAPSLIRDAVTRLEEQVARLHGVLSAMETRLDTVLQPVPPSVTATANTMQSGSSHLHSRLVSLGNDLDGVTDYVVSVIRRVEI